MCKDVWVTHSIIVVKHFESLRESQDHKIYLVLLIGKSFGISRVSDSFVVQLLFCGFPNSSQFPFIQLQVCNDVLSCIPNDGAIIKLTCWVDVKKIRKV